MMMSIVFISVWAYDSQLFLLERLAGEALHALRALLAAVASEALSALHLYIHTYMISYICMNIKYINLI